MFFARSQKLYLVLVGIFVTSILTSEIVGGKLFSLEQTLGFSKLSVSLFGVDDLSFTLTAGVIGWPMVFTITDVVNDYYGFKGVRFMSYLSVLLIVVMLILLKLAIYVCPSEFWLISNRSRGINNMQEAYDSILGQSITIMIASIIAFLVGQLFDAMIFRKIKKITGNKLIWLRAIVSTIFSQLIDTVCVLYVAFYIFQNYSFNLVSAWVVMSYIYKFSIAIIFLPLVYVFHFGVELFLGKSTAMFMRRQSIK